MLRILAALLLACPAAAGQLQQAPGPVEVPSLPAAQAAVFPRLDAPAAAASPQATASQAPQAPAAAEAAEPAAAPAPAAFEARPSFARRLLYSNFAARRMAARLLDRNLGSALGDRLSSEPALAPHARFWSDQSVRIELVPAKALGASTRAASYSHNRRVVRINRDRAARWLCEIAAQGAPFAQGIDVLTEKLLPLLAHELRHGITKTQWQRALGHRLPIEARENEVLSFADELRVWQGLKDRPSASAELSHLDEHHRIVASYWARDGWAGLDSIIDQVYRQPALLGDRQAVHDAALAAAVRTLGGSEISGLPQTLAAASGDESWSRFQEGFRPLYEEQKRAVAPAPEETHPASAIVAALKATALRRLAFRPWVVHRLLPRLLGGAVVKTMTAELARLASTGEEAAYLARQGPAIKLDGAPRLDAHDMALYDRGARDTIYLNRDRLGVWLAYRLIEGDSPRQAARTVGLKFLPTLAHEVRHAITDGQWLERLGFTFMGGNIETEMISHAQTVRVIGEVRARHEKELSSRPIPGLDDHHDELLELWRQGGWSALGAYVRREYETRVSILRTERGELHNVMSAIGLVTAVGMSQEKDAAAAMRAVYGDFRAFFSQLDDAASWEAFRGRFSGVYARQLRAVSPRLPSAR